MNADQCLGKLRQLLVYMEPSGFAEAEPLAAELRGLVSRLTPAEAVLMAPQLANTATLGHSAATLIGQYLEASGGGVTGYTADGVRADWQCGPVLRA
jgi:hypothetical protein